MTRRAYPVMPGYAIIKIMVQATDDEWEIVKLIAHFTVRWNKLEPCNILMMWKAHRTIRPNTSRPIRKTCRTTYNVAICNFLSSSNMHSRPPSNLPHCP